MPARSTPASPARVAPIGGTAVVTPLLDEQICFSLYNASRAITAHYRTLLKPLGLTYPQYLVLLVLWEQGEISVTHLGERLQLESGTLSPLLKRLEASDFVTRTRRASDERVVDVALTSAGERLRSRVQHIPTQICAATGMQVSDIQRLRDELDELSAVARKAS